MENCLVTTLRATVDNNALNYLNAFSVVIKDWSKVNNGKLYLNDSGGWNMGGPGLTVKIISNGAIYHGSGTLDGSQAVLPSYSPFYYIQPIDNTKETKFIVIGLTGIVGAGFNGTTSDNVYSPSAEKVSLFDSCAPYHPSASVYRLFIFPSSPDKSILTDIGFVGGLDVSLVTVLVFEKGSIKGDISAFQGLVNVGELSISESPQLYGDVESFSELDSLVKLQINEDEMITGDISNLGGLIHLEEIQVYNTNVYGTVESFVAAQIAAGRTSGTIKKFNSNGVVTFGGNVVSAGHHNIVWDGVGNITVGDGFIN